MAPPGLRGPAALILFLLCGCGHSLPASPTVEDRHALVISGPAAVLVPGKCAQLEATRRDSMWVDKVITTWSARDVTATALWSSADVSIATVSSRGLVCAVSPGETVVSAASDELTTTIGLRVWETLAQVTGQIDPEVAADIIGQNQDLPINKRRGTIMRFDLPVRVYIDASFGRFGDCGQRAVRSWEAATGLPFLYIGENTEPRIQMIVLKTEDSRARTAFDPTYLDNSLRGASLIMPPWNLRCDEPSVEDTVTHELGHALGILGHPPWGGVMADLVRGVDPGVRQPSAREARVLVELYKLPVGAHVEPDGTWVVQ